MRERQREKSSVSPFSFLKLGPRRAVTLARWLDLLLLTVVACVIYFFLRPFFEPYISESVGIIGLLPLPLRWILYSVIFAVVWLPVVRAGGFSVKSFLSSAPLLYPPFWLACAFGIIVIWFLQPYISVFLTGRTVHPSVTALTLALGAAVTGAAGATLWRVVIERLTSAPRGFEQGSVQSQAKPVIEDIEALLDWIAREAPIETPDQDVLNTKLFARRIVETLNRLPLLTITVVGGYGMGKSSILKMVKHYLRNSGGVNTGSGGAEKRTEQNRSMILVEVCGWGLQKDRAAETILKQVIEKCSDHVDCFGLSNLPSQYSAAIGSASKWSKAVSGLLFLSYDPMATLERLDRVLLSIDKNVVVFLEDMDRNWQGSEFWSEVVSLLDRLKKLQQVSFVLAVTDKGKIGEIVNRISDHVEVVPRLSVNDVAAIYKLFRNHCFQQYNDIRFEEEESRSRRINAENIAQRDEVGRRLNIKMSEEIDAIAALIESPRNLKHALRRTYRAWESLHGEIEFDHLFVANVFRVAELEVFNFIHENLSDIRWLGRRVGSPEDKKATEDERKGLQEKLAAAISPMPSRMAAIEKLIYFLFPGWSSSSPVPQFGVIQGVSNPQPIDYWDRLIRERLNDSEISDQALAGAISRWKVNTNAQVYDGLQLAEAISEIPEFSEKVLQFGELLDGQQVLALASQLFELVFHTRGLTDRDFPGRTELHQLIIQKESVSQYGDWLVGEVNKLFPFRLSVAVDVYEYWIEPLFETGEKQRVRNAVLKGAESHYSDKAVFIDALKSDKDNAVLRLIATLSHEIYGGPGSLHDDWRWLGELLLDCAATHYSIIIPKILGFAVIQRIPPKGPWILASESLQTFFQERTRELMLLLSQVDVSRLSKKESQKVTAAQEQAIKWLSDNPTKPDKV
jgi:hypothetical protein